MRDKLESLMLDYEQEYNSFVFDRGRLADFLIAHGVTFATDNNVPCKWIPVSERLPNDREDVLLYDKNFGLIDIGTYYKVGSRGSRKQTPRFVIIGSKHPIDDYTHWMPLPEAPKEGDVWLNTQQRLKFSKELSR